MSDYTKVTLKYNDNARFPCRTCIELKYNGKYYRCEAEGPDFQASWAAALRVMVNKTGLPEWMVREYLDLADIQMPFEDL